MRWSPAALQAREGAREEERRRLARELHDDLSQALSVLKIELAWLEHRVKGEPSSNGTDVHEKVQVMRQLVERAMQTVRTVITELRPETLDRLGLVAALEWQAESFAPQVGLPRPVTPTGGSGGLHRGRARPGVRALPGKPTH